jgi:4'-phosphopantetheinyl transferase
MTDVEWRPHIRVDRISEAQIQECGRRSNPGQTWVDVRWSYFLSNDEIQWRSLSDEELHRYHMIASRERADEFARSRVLLRQCLSKYLNCSPVDVPIAAGRWGKPQLPPQAQLFFNISHSQGILMIAVSNVEVGVDIENRFTNSAVWALQRLLSEREVERIRKLPSASQLKGFAQTWSRKEALVKAWGCGFSQERELPEIFVGDGLEATVTDDAGTMWYITDIDVSIIGTAALAVRRDGHLPVRRMV